MHHRRGLSTLEDSPVPPMHELSLAESIVEIVRQHLPAEGHTSVRSVTLRVGALAGVVPQSLEFCFGVVASGTELRDARLVLEHVPARVSCSACGALSAVEPEMIWCPACGSRSVTLRSGDELQVAGIEVEDGAERKNEIVN